MSEDQIEPVFLNDHRIVSWDRPLDGAYIVFTPDASTNLVGDLGVESFDSAFGDYRLSGIAAKYIADIAPLGEKLIRFHEENPTSNESERRILYSGSLTIFHKGFIPGTELYGWDGSNGKIWFSRPLDKKDESLEHAVLGSIPSFETISAIINGYRIQEENERRAQSEREASISRQAGFNATWLSDHGY